MDLEYYTSERFIHDDLLADSQRVIAQAKKIWEEGQTLPSYVIAWPSKKILADDGTPIDRSIIMELPASRSEWRKALEAFVRRTSAYGLLVIELRDLDLHAVFESPHGTRAWSLPIQRHGDRWALGDQRVSDNEESLTLLWSPHRGAG